MEAEARKASKLRVKKKENMNIGMRSIKTFFCGSLGSKENSSGTGMEKVIENTLSSSTSVGKLLIFSPKRKMPMNLNTQSMGESPNKRRKIFERNLSYWRNLEGEVGSSARNEPGPTTSKLRAENLNTQHQNWRELDRGAAMDKNLGQYHNNCSLSNFLIL